MNVWEIKTFINAFFNIKKKHTKRLFDLRRCSLNIWHSSIHARNHSNACVRSKQQNRQSIS